LSMHGSRITLVSVLATAHLGAGLGVVAPTPQDIAIDIVRLIVRTGLSNNEDFVEATTDTAIALVDQADAALERYVSYLNDTLYEDIIPDVEAEILGINVIGDFYESTVGDITGARDGAIDDVVDTIVDTVWTTTENLVAPIDEVIQETLSGNPTAQSVYAATSSARERVLTNALVNELYTAIDKVRQQLMGDRLYNVTQTVKSAYQALEESVLGDTEAMKQAAADAAVAVIVRAFDSAVAYMWREFHAVTGVVRSPSPPPWSHPDDAN